MFEHLKHLIQTKQSLKEDLTIDTSFTPFMAQRWISMHNITSCISINETTNRLYQGLLDKNSWYKMLQVVTPCNSYKYIKYIKKSKNNKAININHINFIADNLQISKKEAAEYITNNPNITKQLKKTLGE